MPTTVTRWPASCSIRARLSVTRWTPPSSSMLLATRKTSRAVNAASPARAPLEVLLHDVLRRPPGLVLAEALPEGRVALGVGLAHPVDAPQRGDQAGGVLDQGAGSDPRQVEVGAALVTRVVLVVVGVEHHRAPGV